MGQNISRSVPILPWCLAARENARTRTSAGRTIPELGACSALVQGAKRRSLAAHFVRGVSGRAWPGGAGSAKKLTGSHSSGLVTAAMRKIFFMAVAWAGALALLGLAACGRAGALSFQGYIEGEYVYVASPLAGHLEELAVSRGDVVVKDQRLFVLEHKSEEDQVREAASRLRQAEARLLDQRKGKRPSEIAALEAQLGEAKSRLALAESQFQRRRKLGQSETGVISREEVERSAAELDAFRARVAQLNAELETARLGARADEIAAAEDQVAAQRAILDQAEWALRQKTARSPAAGLVQDTLYRTGEWVGAGRPAVVLLPPENVKVRFFVPQPQLAAIQTGQTFEARIDGASRPYPGRVAFVSTQAEFTPPVIYSDERRAKLVYMVEGEFPAELARELKPGQPVEVFPTPAATSASQPPHE